MHGRRNVSRQRSIVRHLGTLSVLSPLPCRQPIPHSASDFTQLGPGSARLLYEPPRGILPHTQTLATVLSSGGLV